MPHMLTYKNIQEFLSQLNRILWEQKFIAFDKMKTQNHISLCYLKKK